MNRTLKRILCTLLAASLATAPYAAITDGYVFVNGAYIKQSDGSGPYSIDSSGVATLIGSGGGGGVSGVTQGSATAGQSGPLTQAAVTTSNPSYTNGQTSPINMDTSGNLRVTVAGGGGAIAGGTAHDAAGAAVNPVASGGYASAAAPTDVSADGDIVRAWFLRNGAQAQQITYAGVMAATGAGTVNSGTPRFTLAADDPLITLLSSDDAQLTTLIDRNSDTAPVSSSVTSATTIFTQDMTHYGSISLQVTVNAGSSTLQFEVSEDGVTWSSVYGIAPNSLLSSTSTSLVTTTTGTGQWKFPKFGRYFRARVSTYGGSVVTTVHTVHKAPFSLASAVFVANTLTLAAGQAAHDAAATLAPIRIAGKAVNVAPTAVSATGDTHDLVTTMAGAVINKQFAIPEADWNYAAAASGIVNTTTAVTIKAAAGAGIRNYVTGVDLMCEALGTATEIAIRDGAGGTVLWRTKVGTGGLTNGRSINFTSPLKSTANTLLEVVTLTASGTGACYFNATGYVAP
jgi:hypothetical protein